MSFKSSGLRHLSLGLITALSISACTTPSQTNSSSSVKQDLSSSQINSVVAGTTEKNLISQPVSQDNSVSQVIKGNPNFVSNQISSDVQPYRSLRISSGFSTKGYTFNFQERAVIVQNPLTPTTTYALSKSFMDKFRDVIFNATTKAIFDTSNFDRLTATGTVAVPKVVLASGNFVSPYNSTYTLTASETAFVALFRTYNSVVMPNYLNDTDGAPVPLPVPTSQDIQLIINTTGINKQFYIDILGKLSDDFGSYAGFSFPDAILSKINIGVPAVVTPASPATGLYAAANLSTIASPPTYTTAEKTANKAFLDSIVKSAPYAKGVVLIDQFGSVKSGDISLYYGENEQLGSLTPSTTVSNFGTPKLYNDLTTAVVGNNKLPLATTNYTGAGAILDAKLLTDGSNFSSAVSTLGFANYAAGASDTNMSYAQGHNAVRALHMNAGNATASLTPALSLTFGTLVAPLATANASVTLANTTFGAAEKGTLGKAIDLIFTGGMTKIGKSTALVRKNQLGVDAFFGSGGKALIVPCTRDALGNVTLTSAGTNTVAITANPIFMSNPIAYNFYMSDPAYDNKSGFGYNIVYNSLLIYDYTGTLIGVQ